MAFHLISADIMKLIRDPDTNCKTLNPIRMQHLGSSAEPLLPTSWLSRLGINTSEVNILLESEFLHVTPIPNVFPQPLLRVL